MAKRTITVKKFMEFIDPRLDTSKRQEEINDQMNSLRSLYHINADWIEACLNKIPKNEEEQMYVAFTLGYEAGKNDEQLMQMN